MKTIKELESIRRRSRFKRVILHESELGVEPNDERNSAVNRQYINTNHPFAHHYLFKHRGALLAEVDDREKWGKEVVEPFKPIKVAIPKRKKKISLGYLLP